MTPSELTMTALLRAALWDRTPAADEIPKDTDWKAVMDCAVKQSVQGLVAAAIVDWADTRGAAVDEAIVEACLKLQFSTINTNEHVNRVAAEVTQRLAGGGMDAILVKGQGVAQYYTHPQLRAAGDIDIFLGDKAEEAATLLKPIADRGELTDLYRKHITMERHGVEVEIHRYVINRNSKTSSRVLGEWCRDELVPAKCRKQPLANGQILVPSAFFDTVFIFYHLWHHQFNGGIGLRQFCDWAMILHRLHGQTDTDRLQALLRQAGLLRSWRVLGCILVDLLGFPAGEFPFYQARHKLAARLIANRIFELGNFGHGDYEAFMERNTYKGIFHKAYTLAHFLKRDFYNMVLSPKAAWQQMGDFYHF